MSFGEILHPAEREARDNFWGFLESRCLRIEGKGPHEIFSILDKYFDYLRSLSGDRAPHFDVMYNNLGAINPVWSHPCFVDPIFLLRYFSRRGFWDSSYNSRFCS